MRSTLVGSLLLLILTEAAPAFAQTQFTTLASFAGGNGKDPLGGLVLSGGTLFGTTSQGGQYGWGTVFSLPVSNGTINTMTSFGPPGVNSGVAPDAGLVLSGNTLYGTLSATYSVALGYANGNEGNVFSIPVSGGTPTNLESLAGHVNYGPRVGLTLSGNTLFGISGYGSDEIAVFSVNTDGTSPSLVSNIGALAANGGAADGSLTVVGSNLYGTIDVSYGDGVIFSAPIAGGAATLLTTFSGANGASPRSDLIYANGNLYGTTYSGGAYGDGTVFSEPLSGGSPTVLTSFNGSDGGNPIGGLVLVGNTLYGTTEGDVDPNDAGTVFSLPVTGGTPTTLATFEASGDNGSNPQAGLVYDGQGHLYGETPSGGVSNDGTVFEITVAVPEPSGFSVLALGAASLLRRPRKQTAGS